MLHLSTHIPDEVPSDNLTFLWNFWWMRKALESHLPFFHDVFTFAPVGADLTLHTHTALPAFVASTLLKPLAVTTACNVTLLAIPFSECHVGAFVAYQLTRIGSAPWWLGSSLKPPMCPGTCESIST